MALIGSHLIAIHSILINNTVQLFLFNNNFSRILILFLLRTLFDENRFLRIVLFLLIKHV